MTDFEHFSSDQFEDVLSGWLTNGGDGHAVGDAQLLDADVLLDEIESVEEVVDVNELVKGSLRQHSKIRYYISTRGGLG